MKFLFVNFLKDPEKLYFILLFWQKKVLFETISVKFRAKRYQRIHSLISIWQLICTGNCFGSRRLFINDLYKHQNGFKTQNWRIIPSRAIANFRVWTEACSHLEGLLFSDNEIQEGLTKLSQTKSALLHQTKATLQNTTQIMDLSMIVNREWKSWNVWTCRSFASYRSIFTTLLRGMGD